MISIPSRAERGAYGEGTKIQNWDTYNPLGLKTKPFPTEYICPLCEEKKEFVFPVQLQLCPKCVQKVIERKDIYWVLTKRIVDMSGNMCLNCGTNSVVTYMVNTRICQKCTTRLGKNQKRYQAMLKYARKVV
jgi:hypothetical protein